MNLVANINHKSCKYSGGGAWSAGGGRVEIHVKGFLIESCINHVYIVVN